MCYNTGGDLPVHRRKRLISTVAMAAADIGGPNPSNTAEIWEGDATTQNIGLFPTDFCARIVDLG
jgi:hypothetical protein